MNSSKIDRIENDIAMPGCSPRPSLQQIYCKQSKPSSQNNGFGEIAMTNVCAENCNDSNRPTGIDESYDGNDQWLLWRLDNMTNDDGSEFPVRFYDSDHDGKLSVGDQFTVYGSGNSANGPAQDGWRLDIQFDATGDIIGSAQLL